MQPNGSGLHTYLLLALGHSERNNGTGLSLWVISSWIRASHHRCGSHLGNERPARAVRKPALARHPSATIVLRSRPSPCSMPPALNRLGPRAARRSDASPSSTPPPRQEHQASRWPGRRRGRRHGAHAAGAAPVAMPSSTPARTAPTMSLTPVPIGSPSSTRHHRHLPARCPSVGAQRRMWGDFVVGAASDAVCNASDLAGIAGSSRSPSGVSDDAA